VNVAIAGAHGQIALRLTRLLAPEGGRVIGLIRNPDHAAEVSRAGAVPVRCRRVRIDSAPFSGPVSRDDVASALARLLPDSRSVGRVLYLSSGAQSLEQALDEVLGTTERDAS
jgi:nucleoside-diphosphate-sugar epimerase